MRKLSATVLICYLLIASTSCENKISQSNIETKDKESANKSTQKIKNPLPIIDAKDNESLKKSFEKIKDSLSQEKAAHFEKSYKAIGEETLMKLKNNGFKGLLADGENFEEKMKTITEALLKAFNGKTADEIIAEGKLAVRRKEERDRKRKEEEKRQALAEIAELKEKQAKAEEGKKELEKFEVKRSRFYKRETGFMQTPIIDMTVVNGTRHPIARAYFKGTLASPGRSIPWLRDDFNYPISGGLEPGEEANWKLSPNMFGGWSSVEAPQDAVLTIEVVRLDGANGESLFDSEQFNKDDAERLETLFKEYPE